MPVFFERRGGPNGKEDRPVKTVHAGLRDDLSIVLDACWPRTPTKCSDPARTSLRHCCIFEPRVVIPSGLLSDAQMLTQIEDDLRFENIKP